MNVATAVEAVKTHFGLSLFSFIFLCGICEGKIYSDFFFSFGQISRGENVVKKFYEYIQMVQFYIGIDIIVC